MPLLAALTSMGYDRVVLSVDTPCEDSGIAGRFLDQAVIDESVRDKVARLNAMEVMRLGL